jgi:hypothetical protein
LKHADLDRTEACSAGQDERDTRMLRSGHAHVRVFAGIGLTRVLRESGPGLGGGSQPDAVVTACPRPVVQSIVGPDTTRRSTACRHPAWYC